MFSHPASLLFQPGSIFGFLRHLGGKQAEVAPVAARSSGSTLVLVSQEDIYGRGHRRQPILLLRKGQEIPAHDLPKLIQNGIRPDQVRFQYATDSADTDPVSAWDEHALYRKPGGMTPPGNIPPIRPQSLQPPSVSQPDFAAHPYESYQTYDGKPSHTERGRQTVLLLEPDPKSLKRLIDCLFGCGFSLSRIHPLRIPAHLSWALERHQPDILIADYRFIAAEGGLTALRNRLSTGASPERIILTLDPHTMHMDSGQIGYDASPLSFGFSLDENERDVGSGLVQILRKPVSRFAMKRLLTEEVSVLH